MKLSIVNVVAASAAVVQAASSDCSGIQLPTFDDFTVMTTQGVEVINATVYAGTSPVSFCNFSLTLTHPNADDDVYVEMWLPLSTWNGRYMATGGGAYQAGYQEYLIEPILYGYATAYTDAGLTLGNTIDPQSGSWGLNADGTINAELVKNFAYRSIHDMTVVAKEAIQSFYGSNATYSYYSGCSTGGRQGYYAAQYYPADFDGVLANSPALFTTKLSPSLAWPVAVQNDIEALPECIYTAYTSAMIAECDPLDGVTDGLISRPDLCDFDTESLVGTKLSCTGGNVTITSKHAKVVSSIVAGPRNSTGAFEWYGIQPGADFFYLSNTTTVDGKTVIDPPNVSQQWIRYFLAKNASFSMNDLSVDKWQSYYEISVDEFSETYNEDASNLTDFKAAGGKLLTWHGLADQVINYEGTTLYHSILTDNMNGADLDSFYRVFLAPGVGHCTGGYGPIPSSSGALTALVSWVEAGVAPDTLAASYTADDGVTTNRNLCMYPSNQVYVSGNITAADSFTCS